MALQLQAPPTITYELDPHSANTMHVEMEFLMLRGVKLLSPIWGMSLHRFTPIHCGNECSWCAVLSWLRSVPPGPVSSAQPIAGFSAMASRLFSTPTKSNATRGPVVTDPQPKLRQLSLRASLQVDPPEAPSTPEKLKRQYKARGTSGTFGGKHPPKQSHCT